MKKVILINGSPRTEEKTTSAEITGQLEKMLRKPETETYTIRVRKSLNSAPESDYEKMAAADAIVFTFPLYYFCLPGMVMGYLQNFEMYCREHKIHPQAAKVYAVINCGFPEPEINTEAARVISCFCMHMGMQFRFAILIGAGPVIFQQMPPAVKARKQLDTAMLQIADDIGSNADIMHENISIQVKFPQWLYYFFGSLGWKQDAKRNGLTVKDMYRQVYQ